MPSDDQVKLSWLAGFPQEPGSSWNKPGRPCGTVVQPGRSRQRTMPYQPVVKVWLHSGSPTRLPPLGARRQRRCSSFKILPGIATPPRKPRAAGAPVLSRPPSFAEHSRSRELRRDVAEALAEAGRALPAGRLARLGATPDSHHGLLRRQKVLPAGPSLHACGARLRQSLDNVAARLLKRRCLQYHHGHSRSTRRPSGVRSIQQRRPILGVA